jgi:hypothetical protein
LLGDLLKALLRLGQARLEAEAALELGLGGLEIAALQLIETGVVMGERGLRALQAAIRAAAGREEQPGGHDQQPGPRPAPAAQRLSSRDDRQRQAESAGCGEENDRGKDRHTSTAPPAAVTG